MMDVIDFRTKFKAIPTSRMMTDTVNVCTSTASVGSFKNPFKSTNGTTMQMTEMMGITIAMRDTYVDVTYFLPNSLSPLA